MTHGEAKRSFKVINWLERSHNMKTMTPKTKAMITPGMWLKYKYYLRHRRLQLFYRCADSAFQHLFKRNSAKVTDQRGSYAFSCSTFTIHVRHFLPISDIKHVL